MEPRAEEQPGSRGGPVLRALVGVGLAGPAALVTALVVSGADGSTMDLTVSALAAEGRHGGLLLSGQLVFALGLIALAVLVHRALPGRSGLGPAALVVSGLAGLVLVSFECAVACMADGLSTEETVHIGAATVGGVMLGLAPLLLARRVKVEPAWAGFRRLSLATGILTGVAMLGWAAAVGAPWEGGVERFAIAVPAAWVAVTAWRVGSVMLGRSEAEPADSRTRSASAG